MKIVEVSREDYNKFALGHPQISFYQTKEWGDLKASTGWIQHLLAYKDDDGNILAAGNFLLKKTPVVEQYLAYCPRGFLIDYKDKKLVESFNTALAEYLKGLGCFELLIDPNYPCIQRDIDGNIVENGYDNRDVVENLKSLGYFHNGYNLYYEGLQPRWLFRLDISKPYEELESNFKNEAKRRSRKKDFLAITTREMTRDEIPTYKRLMEMTAKRRKFEDRPLEYYINMYDSLHDAGIMRYMVSEMNIAKCKENVTKEIEIIEERIKKLKKPGAIKEEEVTLNMHKNLLTQIENLEKEKGNIIPLSVTCIMTTGNEMIMLLAGNDEDYLQHFNSSNIMVTDLIKLAQKEGYDYFNFYGITGDFTKENPHYGLYLYKRQYGGEVIELIGEFEYTINQLVKQIYDISMKLYHKLK